MFFLSLQLVFTRIILGLNQWDEMQVLGLMTCSWSPGVGIMSSLTPVPPPCPYQRRWEEQWCMLVSLLLSLPSQMFWHFLSGLSRYRYAVTFLTLCDVIILPLDHARPEILLCQCCHLYRHDIPPTSKCIGGGTINAFLPPPNYWWLLIYASEGLLTW